MGIREILNTTGISDKLGLADRFFHSYEHQLETIGHDVVTTGTGAGWTLHQWLSVAAVALILLLSIAIYSALCCIWKTINCTFNFAQCALCGCCDLGINKCSVACMLCSVVKAALVGGWLVVLLFFSAQVPICELGFLRPRLDEHAPDDNCKYAVHEEEWATLDEVVGIAAYTLGAVVSLLMSACSATCGRESNNDDNDCHHSSRIAPARAAVRRGRRRITMMEDDDLYDL